MPDKQNPGTPIATGGYAGLEAAVLRRYVSGESTPEELRRVDCWASDSEERRRYLSALRALYQRVPVAEARAAQEAWALVVARMDPMPGAEDPVYLAPWDEPATRVTVGRRRARIITGAFAVQPRRWSYVAAAAAVLAFAGWEASPGTHSHPSATRLPTMRQIVTAKGQRAEIQLEDGSRVTLGVASSLRLSSDFGVRTREIFLEGTAYFDVVHDAAHPFVVRTTNAVARDVGTRFVVSAYPETHATQVVVRDGAVALGGVPELHAQHTHSVLLTSGNLGQLRAGDTVVTKRNVDPELYTAWTQGDLVFHDLPLRDAVAELRRWYAVDIRIGDPTLQDIPISASFAAESLHEALAVFTTVLPLRAVRRGNVVTLYRRSP